MEKKTRCFITATCPLVSGHSLSLANRYLRLATDGSVMRNGSCCVNKRPFENIYFRFGLSIFCVCLNC